MEAVKRQQQSSFNRAYFGQYQLVDASGLRAMIYSNTGDSLGADLRAFRVVTRYLAELGYQAGKTDDGELVLVQHTPKGARARRMTIARMLYLCRDTSREKQSSAQTRFQRMCAEEDEEELELVLELYHKTQRSAIGVKESEPTPPILLQPTPCDNNEGEVSLRLLKKPKEDYIPPYMLF